MLSPGFARFPSLHHPTHPTCLPASLPLSPSLTPPPPLSLSIYLYISLSLSIYLSISLSLSLSIPLQLYIVYMVLLPASHNHQGRRGTTADIGDNLLSSLTVFGCSLTAVEVETSPLSDVVFPSFLLPSSFSFPWYCALYDLFCRGHLI